MERMSSTAGEILSIVPNEGVLETSEQLSAETQHTQVQELGENPEVAAPNIDVEDIGSEGNFWQRVVASTDEIAALLEEIDDEKLETIGEEPLDLIDIPIPDEMIKYVNTAVVKQRILDSLKNF